MRPPNLTDPTNHYSLDDDSAGRHSSAPGTPRWVRLLPLSALLLAGLVYVSILSINWTPLFKPLTPTDFVASVVRGGVLDPLHDGDRVSASEKLRFQVESSEPVRVAVLALGSDKKATLLLPAEGSSLLLPAGKLSTLDGEYALPRVGKVKLLAVLCHSNVPSATIRKAGERALMAAQSPDAVRTLDLGCSEHTVTVTTLP